MKTAKSYIIWSLFAMALIALAILLISAEEPAATDTPAEAPKKDAPNYIVENARRVEMDEQGNPVHELKVKRLLYYADSDTSELVAPHLTVFNEDGEWVIHAEHGKTLEKHQKVVLWGNVTIQKSATPIEPETKLITSWLQYWPKEERAETDKAVTIIQGAHKVEAVGMTVNLRNKHIELLSNVRGYYETPSQ